MHAFLKVLTVAAFAAVLIGCQDRTGSPPAEAPKLYDVSGRVVSADPAKKVIELDHDDIPGLMKAMTMEFTVVDAKLLEGLKPGDSVRGKLKVESGAYVITALEKS